MRNNKGYFIEKGKSGNDILRNLKCVIVFENPPLTPQFDRNGNVVEYTPDGAIFEKDQYGNIVEYAKNGSKIIKDE